MDDTTELDDRFEKAYKEYIDELSGIAYMAPNSFFGKGGVQEAQKKACRRLVDNLMKEK